MRTASSRRLHVELPAVTFDVPAAADILTVPHHVPPLAHAATAIAQAAKAAMWALPVLVDGGTLIQVANSSDGIGAAEYVHELELLQRTLDAWQRRLGHLPRLGVVPDGAHVIPCLASSSAPA